VKLPPLDKFFLKVCVRYLTECLKIVQDEDEEIYYDRKKSFFDNISCEAVERSKG
jgi:hypothetical protein